MADTRFDWENRLNQELESFRSHTTKHFPHPDGGGKIVCIQSRSNFHALTDTGFKDIFREMPDYSFPEGKIVNSADDSFIMDLPSWGDARVEEGGDVVRVYDKEGKSIFVYRNLISVPSGSVPYSVVDKNGNFLRDAFSDTKDDIDLHKGEKKKVNADHKKLKFRVEGKKLYTDFPANTVYPVQVYDLTDTASTNNIDIGLRSADPNTNENTAGVITDAFSTDIWRTCFKWTLSSGSGTISDIKLFLYKWDNSGTDSITLRIHEMTQTGFTETGATWNKYDGTNNWATAGGDFSATIVDSMTRTSDVNLWIDWGLSGPTSDNPISGITWGSVIYLMFKSNPETSGANNATQYRDGEYAVDTTKRPYIEITYTVAGGNNLMSLMGIG